MIKNKGFTLVELLVVIAILSLIATISMPSLSNMYARKEMENENRVKENLENATEVYMQMNNDENTFNCKCIKVATLIKDGVISSKEAKKLDLNVINHYVKVIKVHNSSYKYEYCKECDNCQ